MIANHLTQSSGPGYASAVPEKKGAGLENLNYPKRTNGAMPFFYVCMLARVLHWAALGGGFGLPVALDTGFSTRLCRPPRLVAGSGVTNTKESRND